MNHELAKTLTTALVQFIDRERPEGTMCCSSYECESIEQMFEGGCYDIVEKFIKKKLLDMTEFELEVSDIVDYCKEHGENVAFDYAKRHANTLLSLARRELLSYADESNPAIEAMADLERAVTCGNVDNIPKWLQEELNKAFKKGQESSHEDYLRGYANGYKDAEKQYNESVAYHFPIMPTPPSGWGCDGTHCMNPHHDCINCPVRYSSGGTITTPNTATGTSTLKAEG